MRWSRGRKRPSAVRLKTEGEIEAMRESGRLVAQVLQAVSSAVGPCVTTIELDRMADDLIRDAGAIASFRGVRAPVAGVPPYPAATCISVNEEVVHGVPGPRILREGDIVSLDIGVILSGWHGDATVTVGVGGLGEEAARLLSATRESLMAGIARARAGGWLGDISAAIQEYAESRGYSVVREYTGHAIGREMHEGFQVPNFGRAGSGLRLREGMTMAIEPMVNVGRSDTLVEDNGWTVVTVDRKLSAHFEHSIAVTRDGPLILTEL